MISDFLLHNGGEFLHFSPIIFLIKSIHNVLMMYNFFKFDLNLAIIYNNIII